MAIADPVGWRHWHRGYIARLTALDHRRIGGFQMYRAEVPGLDKDRLAPRIRDTARLLLRFYLILTALMTVACLWLGVGVIPCATR